MSNEALTKLQDKIMAEAVKGINIDGLVKKLTKKLEEEIIESHNHALDNIDLAYWLREELEDNSTKAGKAFSKAVSNIAGKMAKAVSSS